MCNQICLGEEYIATDNYPKEKVESKDINKNERFKIIEISEDKKEFKILNLSLGTPDAWVTISEDELRKII